MIRRAREPVASTATGNRKRTKGALKMDRKIEAMRLIGKLSLEGKLVARTVGHAEFLDDCVQVYTGCRFGMANCTHADCAPDAVSSGQRELQKSGL
jgi:hypothetical protein